MKTLRGKRMRLLDYQNKINELMSAFVTQIKGATAMGRTDIKIISETVLIPIFREVYGYLHLENLNYEENNYPGIDLGDKEAKVAIQVTSTPTIDKVKETLEKFLLYKLDEQYDRVIIYILTEKQKSYSVNALRGILQDRFSFNPQKDILDYTDILYEASFFDVYKSKKLVEILEENFRLSAPNKIYSSESLSSQEETETVHLNLLELSFPDTLYVAELALGEVSEQNSGSEKKRRGGYKYVPKREKVRQALSDLGLKFAVDWECYENSLITFHDLSDNALPLANIIDLGTVTPLEPDEFYDFDENQERVFKSLLRRCLQQKMYHRQVIWQNIANEFIFSADIDQDIRKESWVGKKESDRTVYEVTRKDDGSVWYIKHLAFQTQFLHFDEKWYLLIKPEWFFSYDGYKPSFYLSEKVDWLKKQEKNYHVYNHLRFITHFLAHEEQSTLFKQVSPYPFLSFGELVSFSSSPGLIDTEWNPPKDKEEEVVSSDDQLDFFEL